MNFLKSSIDELRDHEPNDPPRQAKADEVPEERTGNELVWRVTFKPGKGVEVRLLDVAEVQEVRNGEERVGFLPVSYFNKVSKIRK